MLLKSKEAGSSSLRTFHLGHSIVCSLSFLATFFLHLPFLAGSVSPTVLSTIHRCSLDNTLGVHGRHMDQMQAGWESEEKNVTDLFGISSLSLNGKQMRSPKHSESTVCSRLHSCRVAGPRFQSKQPDSRVRTLSLRALQHNPSLTTLNSVLLPA